MVRILPIDGAGALPQAACTTGLGRGGRGPWNPRSAHKHLPVLGLAAGRGLRPVPRRAGDPNS